jgi:hypothetical protein
MPDVIRLQPKDFSSDLDEIAREGARRMRAQALEAEVADYTARHRSGTPIVVQWSSATAKRNLALDRREQPLNNALELTG